MVRRKIKSQIVIAELKKLAKAHGGQVDPVHVVAAARHVKSPLHKYFTWDNTEAARRWRILEARNLLRVVVMYKGESREPINVFVSLKPDRVEGGGGYRCITDVLDDDALYDQMLKDALDDLEFFRRKYQSLKELRGIFEEIDCLQKKRK